MEEGRRQHPSHEGPPGRNRSSVEVGEPQPQMTHGPEAMADHEEMMRSHKERTLWTYFVNIILGLCLLASPPTLGYTDDLLFWSDIATGLVVVALPVHAARKKARPNGLLEEYRHKSFASCPHERVQFQQHQLSWLLG
jgi:hypothetical protein